jgi:hypothetical protein
VCAETERSAQDEDAKHEIADFAQQHVRTGSRELAQIRITQKEVASLFVAIDRLRRSRAACFGDLALYIADPDRASRWCWCPGC